MEKEQQENTFFYTYSAKQQTEIQAIRQKYLSAASSDEGVERLRKLDKGARLPGVLAAIFLGLFGVLLFAVSLEQAAMDSLCWEFFLACWVWHVCPARRCWRSLLRSGSEKNWHLKF